jgi:hypothetical protein
MRELLALLTLVLVALPAAGGPADHLTVATVLGAPSVVLLMVWQPPDRSLPKVRVRVLRERAERLAFLRTRDPDAAGRVRPRAPGRGLAAA